MDIEIIENKQKEIDEQIEVLTKSINKEPIYDGIISPKHYFSSPMKVLWLAREPHDVGGNYDYKIDIIDKQNKGELKGKRYFNRFRFLQYSIENNFPAWDKKTFNSNDKEYSDLVLKAAFINCNKVPGGANVNWDIWRKYSDMYSNLVKKQIDLAQPDVIIATGTLNYLESYGYLANASKFSKSYRNYFIANNTIIFDCYHISTRFSVENYCNEINDVLRGINAKKFK